MGIDREGELPSLKKMTAKVLGKEIQGGVHDPVRLVMTSFGCTTSSTIPYFTRMLLPLLFR